MYLPAEEGFQSKDATINFFFLDPESARLQTHCDNCWYSRNKVSALRAER